MEVLEHKKEQAKKLARKLLEIEAVRLSPEPPYTWSSGWKSPIYCDNRLTLSYPKLRDLIKFELSELIKDKFTDAEAISGVATAGIPQGALVADALGLPFSYVRSSAKGHGLENKIEGKVTLGQRVVVIEDLVSTGGSSLKAVEALRQAAAEVIGMVSIFNYGFPEAKKNLESAGVKLYSLCDYDILIEEAKEMDMFDTATLESLRQWQADPANWGK